MKKFIRLIMMTVSWLMGAYLLLTIGTSGLENRVIVLSSIFIIILTSISAWHFVKDMTIRL